ncbi:MAG: hypothetical protein PUH43_03575 [Clostridium sp.]|nr:hypothetical protein [Clostridium sp.]
MPKTNRFYVKEIDKQNVTVEEERKYRSPFILFLIRNGKLILTISLLFSLSVFIIAFSLIMKNIKDSSILTYESNGVIVKFTSSDESILNGTPITPEYANKLFTNSVQNSNNEGVVIKAKEKTLENLGKIIFYSDKTVLIKYNDGTYLRVYPINNSYAVDEDGTVNSNAVRKSLTGEIKQNALGMNILYLSDGSTEVTYQDETIFVRNGDMTSTNDEFYTNLSLVSIKKKEENGKIYYSKNIIKENNTLIIDDKIYKVKKEVDIKQDNIKIIYYENDYAEVIKDDLSIIVEKSEHIRYDGYIFEIVYQKKEEVNIKDLIDIKKITLNNTNQKEINYIIVLEETSNYEKYNLKILPKECLRFSIYNNGKMNKDNLLSNNLKGKEGYEFNNNTYLLYEGKLDKLSTTDIDIGMWIDYEQTKNENMNSAFIGTVKVYIE